MAVSNPASLSSIKAEFQGPNDFKQYYRGGPYVPMNAASQISTTQNGLAISQFSGVSKPAPSAPPPPPPPSVGLPASGLTVQHNGWAMPNNTYHSGAKVELRGNGTSRGWTGTIQGNGYALQDWLSGIAPTAVEIRFVQIEKTPSWELDRGTNWLSFASSSTNHSVYIHYTTYVGWNDPDPPINLQTKYKFNLEVRMKNTQAFVGSFPIIISCLRPN